MALAVLKDQHNLEWNQEGLYTPTTIAQRLGAASFSALVERSGRPLRLRPFWAVLPVLGAALALARQFTHGFTLSEDSILYISWTRRLLSGAGCERWDGAAFDDGYFAPGYSGGLALVQPARVGVIRWPSAGPLNAALHSAAVFAVIRWLRHRITSRFGVGRGRCVIAFAAPRITLTSDILSASAFALWTTLALIAFARFLPDGTDAAWLQTAARAGLASLTRYVGLARATALKYSCLYVWGEGLASGFAASPRSLGSRSGIPQLRRFHPIDPGFHAHAG